jgi:hypothetical protein
LLLTWLAAVDVRRKSVERFKVDVKDKEAFTIEDVRGAEKCACLLSSLCVLSSLFSLFSLSSLSSLFRFLLSLLSLFSLLSSLFSLSSSSLCPISPLRPLSPLCPLFLLSSLSFPSVRCALLNANAPCSGHRAREPLSATSRRVRDSLGVCVCVCVCVCACFVGVCIVQEVDSSLCLSFRFFIKSARTWTRSTPTSLWRCTACSTAALAR